METPIYPPKVQAVILAYETGRERGCQKPKTTTEDVSREVTFDFWRSLMDDDLNPSLGRNIA